MTYTSHALLDVHERCHTSLEQLLAHARTLTADELDREIEGFGYPTIRLQLHHVIGAERYWLGVLEGRMDAEDDEARFPTVESLEAFRTGVSDAMERYLRSASDDALNTPQTVVTWGGAERSLVPAHVVLRTQTHIYQHQGQVVAMCRLLAKPAPGLDYPIT